MAKIIGIDLGTSNSAAAVVMGGKPTIIPAAELLVPKSIPIIDALGEIFNPTFHEAISTITDPNLDDNTITKEIRKGYISKNRVIRPTLVEISKQG